MRNFYRKTESVSALTLVILCALFLPLIALARSGDVDRSFGENGLVQNTVLYGAAGGYYYFVTRVIVEPNGKVILFELDAWDDAGCWMRRLNQDGSLDTTFGVGGIVSSCAAFDRLPDGGFVGIDGSEIVRYDNNMSEASRIVLIPNHEHPSPVFARVGLDGKLIVWGWRHDSPLVLRRYMLDGTPDLSFGTNGNVVIGNVGSSGWVAGGQPDGKILVNHYPEGGIRLNPNGSRDMSFGTNGRIATIDNVLPDGRLLSVYSTSEVAQPVRWYVSRFDRDGRPDSLFDNDGIVEILSPEGEYGWGPSFAVQPNGQILVGGTINGRSSILRLMQSGARDYSFGQNGIASGVVTRFTSVLSMAPENALIGVSPVDLSCQCYQVARFLVPPRTSVSDFDGDGRADLSVYRRSDGVWYTNGSESGFAGVQWGLMTDELVASDYDGDSKADQAVFRNGDWWIRKSSGGYYVVNWGLPGDKPVPADYDGDGKTDIAVVRDGVWWINYSSGGYKAVQWGFSTDKLVPADYDGDGKADPAIFRNGEWWILKSTGGFSAFQWGLPIDKLVPADYDGDGKTDPAIFRDGDWWILRSTGSYSVLNWGLPDDVPAPADFDGDGKADPTVFRGGVWWISKSTGGYQASQWGLPSDRPVPANAE